MLPILIIGLYMANQPLQSIGTTFEILTFAVNPVRRHLMMMSAIYTMCDYTVLYYKF